MGEEDEDKPQDPRSEPDTGQRVEQSPGAGVAGPGESVSPAKRSREESSGSSSEAPDRKHSPGSAVKKELGRKRSRSCERDNSSQKRTVAETRGGALKLTKSAPAEPESTDDEALVNDQVSAGDTTAFLTPDQSFDMKTPVKKRRNNSVNRDKIIFEKGFAEMTVIFLNIFKHI